MQNVGAANQLARLTLFLASFMFLILISLPFLIGTELFSDLLPYALYSLFLTSVGIIIGISLTWLNLGKDAASNLSHPSTNLLTTHSSLPPESLSSSVSSPSSAPPQSGTLSSAIQTETSPRRTRLLSSDEARVIEHLQNKQGSTWQAELVRDLALSASKASRLLSRLEDRGIIQRVRDGMGKRVVLNDEEVGR